MIQLNRLMPAALLSVALFGAWGCSGGDVKKDASPVETPKEKAAAEAEAEAMGIELGVWQAFKAATAKLQGDSPDYATAQAELLAVLEQKPDFAEAHYNVALLYERQGKLEEARTHLERARSFDPEAQEYKVAMGRIYAEAGEFEKAEVLFNEAVARDPNSAAAKNNLAILALKKKDYDKARDYVIEILREDAQNVAALTTLGLIYRAQDNKSLAKYAFEKALCAAGEPLASCTAAEATAKAAADAPKDAQKKPEAAAATPKAAPVKRELADPLLRADLYNNLALVYLNEKDMPRAVAAFSKANETSPRYLESRLNLGAILIEYLDYARANAVFSEAVKIAPDHCVANLGFGATQFATGQYQEAADRYGFYVERCDEKHVSSYERLAKLNESFLKNPGKAIEHYRQLLALSPDEKKQTEYKAMIGFLEGQMKQQDQKQPATPEAGAPEGAEGDGAEAAPES